MLPHHATLHFTFCFVQFLGRLCWQLGACRQLCYHLSHPASFHFPFVCIGTCIYRWGPLGGSRSHPLDRGDRTEAGQSQGTVEGALRDICHQTLSGKRLDISHRWMRLPAASLPQTPDTVLSCNKGSLAARRAIHISSRGDLLPDKSGQISGGIEDQGHPVGCNFVSGTVNYACLRILDSYFFKIWKKFTMDIYRDILYTAMVIVRAFK